MSDLTQDLAALKLEREPVTPANRRWEVSVRYEGRYGSRLQDNQLGLSIGIRW